MGLTLILSRRLSEMRHDRGFSLIELLMAVAIAGVVVGGVYSVYLTQQKKEKLPSTSPAGHVFFFSRCLSKYHLWPNVIFRNFILNRQYPFLM